MRWVIALLIFVAAGIAILVTVIVRDISYADGKLPGGFFIAIGLMNVVSCKVIGRKLFSKTKSGPPFAGKVWAQIGEKGIQLLYLGIGVILALAGCLVIVLSRGSKY